MNFQLTAASPAVDAGMNLSSWGITNDLTGTSRPAGNAYDIGAYEYVASGARMAFPAENALSMSSLQLCVYPSPCRGELTIQLPAEALIKELLVYDLNGRLVSNHSYPFAMVSTVTKDVTTLPIGSYVLRVQLADEQVYTTRFVKI